MLAARRRLLGMLTVLTLGSCTLAVTKMAAWWVIVPPFVMLAGYLSLLREASKADTERRELARSGAAEAAARRAAPPAVRSAVRSVVPSAGATGIAAPAGTKGTAPSARATGTAAAAAMPATSVPATSVPAAPVTPPAPPVPDAEVIRISASLGAGGEEFYDQYADAKLRAVGDLPIPATRRAG